MEKLSKQLRAAARSIQQHMSAKKQDNQAPILSDPESLGPLSGAISTQAHQTRKYDVRIKKFNELSTAEKLPRARVVLGRIKARVGILSNHKVSMNSIQKETTRLHEQRSSDLTERAANHVNSRINKIIEVHEQLQDDLKVLEGLFDHKRGLDDLPQEREDEISTALQAFNRHIKSLDRHARKAPGIAKIAIGSTSESQPLSSIFIGNLHQIAHSVQNASAEILQAAKDLNAIFEKPDEQVALTAKEQSGPAHPLAPSA